MKYKHSQLVLVEFHECAPYIEKFVSNKKITINKVAKHFEKVNGFNEYCDSLTFVDDLSETVLK